MEKRLTGWDDVRIPCSARVCDECWLAARAGDRPSVCTKESCPRWAKLEVISEKAYFVSFDEYMQHQHEMIEERMQRMADQMLGDLKSAPHYSTEGTFWKNKEK